jgi:hypothetical protein
LDGRAKYQPWIIKKNPKLDENRIKIGFFNFTSIMWMNEEILCFIVIFCVASLASPQIYAAMSILVQESRVLRHIREGEQVVLLYFALSKRNTFSSPAAPVLESRVLRHI